MRKAFFWKIVPRFVQIENVFFGGVNCRLLNVGFIYTENPNFHYLGSVNLLKSMETFEIIQILTLSQFVGQVKADNT